MKVIVLAHLFCTDSHEFDSTSPYSCPPPSLTHTHKHLNSHTVGALLMCWWRSSHLVLWEAAPLCNGCTLQKRQPRGLFRRADSRTTECLEEIAVCGRIRCLMLFFLLLFCNPVNQNFTCVLLPILYLCASSDAPGVSNPIGSLSRLC